MPADLKFGRRSPHPEFTHPRIHARSILAAGYSGAVPAVVNWYSGITFPMALNDKIGDCTTADVCHAEQVFSHFGQGITVTVSDGDVLTMYERVGGYVPGQPSTDQGAVIQDVLNDWRKNGIGTPAHRILAFFQVDYTDLAELKACCWLFGGATLGVNFPASGMDQFSKGLPWDYAPTADNTIIGGHDVRLLGVDADGTMHVATWGAVQTVTPAWLARFCEEAWAQADGEWLRNNTSPEGLDVNALNAAFQQVTGQPGPFPAPPPSPAPPAPTPTEPDAVLVSKAWPWATQWHMGANKAVADALVAWRKAKNV